MIIRSNIFFVLIGILTRKMFPRLSPSEAYWLGGLGFTVFVFVPFMIYGSWAGW